jgi:hypothetical protein
MAGRAVTSTLGRRMSVRDGDRFVGRSAELALIDGLLVDDPPASVVLVHGPGGIGKSSLLREVARRGRAAGWTPVVVEGRDLPPLPDAVEAAVAPAHGTARPLVLIDTYERMAALGAHLRRVVLPALPDRTVVVIAGRRPPEAGWCEDGWEALTREIALGPLSPAESLALLEAHGVARSARADELAAWAAGSPLALTFAARAADDPGWRPGPDAATGDAAHGVGGVADEEAHGGDAGGSGEGMDAAGSAAARPGGGPGRGAGVVPNEVVRTLIRRLVAAELDPRHLDVLWLACVARSTTTPLIADVLPHVDADEALAWLAARTFCEPLGDGITLHDLVRRALRSDLRQRDPERERDLRRRVADSLHARAVTGHPLLTMDLAELVEDPGLRALYGGQGAERTRLDTVRPGDADEVARRLAAMDGAIWWPPTRRFFEEAPAFVTIARDDRGLCGFSITVTPASAPPLAEHDPLLGRWLRHARALTPDGNAVLCRDTVDFTGDPRARVQAMLNVAAVLRSGLANPRWCYLPIDPRRADVVAFATALGARRVDDLGIGAGGDLRIECHLLDCGPGGVLGLQRDLVYVELGLAPPPTHPGAAAAVVDVDVAVVRDALRKLAEPAALARSPLARGVGTDERAASVRRLLTDASERAFGDTDNERLLRRVLVHGYLDPGPNHEHTARRLHLSRAAYFRRLRSASERIAAYLAGNRDQDDTDAGAAPSLGSPRGPVDDQEGEPP